MKKKKPFETAAFPKKLKAILRIIGDNLYTLRQTRNESLKTVAKAVGISASHLRRIEKGLVPGFNTIILFMLSRYFEVKAYQIVERNIKPKVSKTNFSTTKAATPKFKKPVKN